MTQTQQLPPKFTVVKLLEQLNDAATRWDFSVVERRFMWAKEPSVVHIEELPFSRPRTHAKKLRSGKEEIDVTTRRYQLYLYGVRAKVPGESTKLLNKVGDRARKYMIKMALLHAAAHFPDWNEKENDA